ncbi:hypothetical protein BIV60_15345 [Bacillus sp. MUM 116]|uniref:Ig-like domain-containing protein n=1 Tax=Bacillus sp. MUM 116 TaxID=1678002 RepID=UPI0008F55882|nr:Ig-like domain-containing protein [Bacillus sp. MUM 116]OIK13051.1 hypothetical protein BIV60_15345 [Bacillus sp. MUM 116]
MKSILLRGGLLACLLLLGWSHQEASAAMTWPDKCTSFGKVKPNQNPSPQHINCLLTNAALEAKIPPEVVKAVAKKESDWRQFDAKGQPFVSPDNGIGLMQITNKSGYDQQQLKTNINYNIQAGVEILKSMYDRKDLPKIKEMGPEVIENWYFPVMAYNGTKPVNSPLDHSTGKNNPNAYQEKVFANIFNDSFLGGTKLGRFPFSKDDFEYDKLKRDNIVFKKPEYTLTDQMHASRYLFKTGDKVVVTNDGVKVRSQSSSSSTATIFAKGTTLIITGNFVYDQSKTSKNQFVWYPVKTADQKGKGYISSAYISRKLELPVVNSVGDRDVYLSGKAPAKVMVQIKNGTKLISSIVSDANGNFKAKIPVQKAGTKLTLSYKDQLNTFSPVKTIIVADKTAPLAPKVNTVTNTANAVSGKTEAKATVILTIKGKVYSGKADASGNYKIVIPIQNTGTIVSVKAKDSAGNVGAAISAKVIRVAPNMPTVGIVKSTSSAVTGSTEKYAVVMVKIGNKTYTAKAGSTGKYKVTIPKQKAGKKLYVSAKDQKGKISATRTITVVK